MFYRQKDILYYLLRTLIGSSICVSLLVVFVVVFIDFPLFSGIECQT